MSTHAQPQAGGQAPGGVLGTNPLRHDALDKVTGRALYGADIMLPGMLYGKMLRSPHAHARIKRIDTSRAQAHPGVMAVVTSADFPAVADEVADFGETMSNYRLITENCMAHGKVLYKGHAVAAVAATSPHVAEEALALIEVEYEPLPAVLDVRQAMEEGAPLLHDSRLTTRSIARRTSPDAPPAAQRVDARFVRGSDTRVASNVASHTQFSGGDVERGFAQADVVVEREFTTRMVHQGYIEPQNCTTFWARDGRITIWLSTQGAFGVRTQTSKMLGVPESSIRVIPTEVGGGFGGKNRSYLSAVTALLSRKSGHPVKIVLTRREVFEATGPTSGSFIRVKMGARKDGKITAAQLYLAYEAGAYPGSAVGSGCTTSLAPYKVENFLVDGYDVVLNKTQAAAYRAPGSPAAAFAVESVVDELAQRLVMDPMELRLRNATREGDRMVSGVVFPRIGGVEVEEAVRSHPHYNAPLEGPWRGRGVAMGWWFNGGGSSSAAINVNDDGTVSLVTGSVDLAGSRTAVAMQAAEVLGIAAEDVAPSVGDTDTIGWTGTSGGSRTTFSTGIAAIEAARQVVELMKARAAILWETQAEDVEFRDGAFVSTKDPKDRLTFKDLAGKLMSTGGPVGASAASNPRQVGSAFAGHICDVEVDPETGKVTILRYTAVQDAGRAVHPAYAEGQIQGGAVQGIGWALNEEYFFTGDGTMANSSFLDYRMPTALDLPMIDTEIVEVPNPGHPLGVRGMGEVPIVPPMGAVANAISRAIGVRMTELPMNPGAVLRALESRKGDDRAP